MYMFGLGNGHLNAKQKRAAKLVGAEVRNVTEQCNCGRGCSYGTCRKSRRHWLEVPNYGAGIDDRKATEVLAAIAEVR